ncbi:colicin-like pore-forming protein [Escherichia albertii]|uniref:colicin-like pore-forming protein n=1 Tax=Escherichia albertii TaxID=208962 RepID=UPI0030C8F883
MAKELGGYGPTAGESMGGTGANLNQQGGHNNSGVHWGGGSGHGNNGGQGNTNSFTSTSTVMKPGESYSTPWGRVVINKDGLPVMNGVIMTNENSSLVQISSNRVSRVLNSLIDRSFMKPEPGEHSGVIGVPATALSRLELANNALAVAQRNAVTAVDNIAKANKAISKAQTRLNNAKSAVPKRQDEVNRAQKVFDAANAKVLSMSGYAHADHNSGVFRAWQQAGYEAQKAKTSLNSHKQGLANAKVEVTAAQKALDDAKKALPVAVKNKQHADSAVASAADMKDAITTVTVFFESVSKRFGERSARLAQELAAQARSAKIRNVPEAIALFNKYKGTSVNKLNAADKVAIVNAFKSLEHAEMAKQLTAYSKVFGRFNAFSDLAELSNAVYKGMTTDKWEDAITKLESMVVSKVAGELITLAFAAAGAPLGIVGFGVVMMLSGVFFGNEKVLGAINISLGLK